MKAVILVGGESTRLRPLTYDVPKAIVPIVNRPFLDRMIEWLRAHSVTEVILTTSYLPQAIEDHFGDGTRHGIELSYLLEPQPLGTGGAIKNCQHFLSDTFLVLNGDILTDMDLTAVIREHTARRARVSIVSTWVEDPSRFGVIVSDEQDWIRRFVEKPAPGEVPSHDINAGVYLLEPETLDEMPQGNFSIERDFFPRLLERGAPVYHHRARGYWIDIGTVDHYRQAHWDILAGRFHTPIPGRQREPNIWVDDGAAVDPAAHLTPPVVVGAGGAIGAGARVGPRAVLGDEARVGPGAVATDCIMWSRSRLEQHAAASGVIVGFDAVVREGASLSDAALRSGETAAGPA